MAWRVIGPEDPAWAQSLARLPDHDVYHTPQWHLAFEGIEQRNSLAYVAEVGGEILLHAFHLRPIEPGLSDIETAYGYSGPLASSADPAFLEEAWAGFNDWAREQGVICEFLRFNPWLENTRFAHPDARLSLDRETVWIALNQTPDDLWAGYQSRQRWGVRKAQRHELICEERPLSADPAGFAAYYRSAMAEIGAEESYFFPDEHFERLARLFGDNAREFRVTRGEELHAAAVFIGWSERLHYHLAASPRATRTACPTNLLIHHAALWAMECGFKTLHLGGGRTSDPADDLLAFKRQFSPRRAEFSIGRRILDQDAYDRLCTAWLERNPGPRPAHFQLYRLPSRS